MSSLREIEACPRRWALAAADYPEIWSRRGYPPRLSIAGLTGSVVHLALETVTKALARAGCKSLEDTDAVQVMRGLGGYSNVINDCVRRILHRFEDNPRAMPTLDVALRSLRSRIPEMRIEAQTRLGRIKLHGGPAALGVEPSAKGRPRTPLGPGTYPELELRAPRIGWRGTADLVTLSNSNCEIVDFKTGAQEVAHRFQLLAYALLWSRDAELNPTGRAADRLTLSYRHGDVPLTPPTSAELDVLEREFLDRRQSAMKALGVRPPQARPSDENCRYCAVRHLCQEYWQTATARVLGVGPSTDAPFMDLEISIITRHGPSSWDGIIEISRGLSWGKRVVLRAPSHELEFERGDRIRVLDAHVTRVADDESQPAVIAMTKASEVFLLPRTRIE